MWNISSSKNNKESIGKGFAIFLLLSILFHLSISMIPLSKNSTLSSPIEIEIHSTKYGEKERSGARGGNLGTKKNSPENKTSPEESPAEEGTSEGKNKEKDENESIEGYPQGDGEILKGNNKLLEDLIRKIERNKFYPQEALRERAEGEVLVSFEVSRDGKATELKIEKSSGNLHLDRAALQSVVKAQPLPPLPHKVKIVLRFKLR